MYVHSSPTSPFCRCLLLACAGLDRLAAVLAAAEAMQTRAREALRTRVPVSELRRVLDEAAALPVYVPEVGAVAAALVKAQEWVQRAQLAAAQVRCTPTPHCTYPCYNDDYDTSSAFACCQSVVMFTYSPITSMSLLSWY